MGVQFIFFVFLCTCLFLLMLLKVVSDAAKPVTKRSNPPPGPYKLPLIGNIHNLITSHPHHKFRDLAKIHGPLMQLQLGEVPTVVVSSAEIAREIMKTHDVIFSHRPFLLAAKILSYGASGIIFSRHIGQWRQLRKICVMELLSAKRVQSFRRIREQEVGALVKSISSNKGSPTNLSKMIFSMNYSLTSKTAIGGGCKDQEALIAIITEIVELASGFCLPDLYPSSKILYNVSGFRRKLEKCLATSDKILQEILDDHRRARRWEMANTGEGEQRQDLVDVLLRLQRHGDDLEYPLTDDNIKAVILDVFAAGIETSSTTMEWAVSELLKDPKLMKRAQSEVRAAFDPIGEVEETGLEELKFLKAVVKETLRLHLPAPLLIPRECSQDCVVEGYEVRAETKVIVNAWAIHRDPEHWEEPERFNPERFLQCSVDLKGTDFSYIPFGSGRRVCPGMLLGMLNVELPLAKVLYHFDWKLANGAKLEDLDMTEAFGITVRRKKDLILVPVVRRPLDVESASSTDESSCR